MEVEEQGEEGIEQEEVVEEQEQEGQINTQDPMSLIQTVAQTTVLDSPDDNTNNVVIQQADGKQYQTVNNEDELNKYFTQIGNNGSNVVSYNESGAFISADSNYNVNNIQGVSTTEGMNQYIQGSSTVNTNFDFNNIGVANSTVYLDQNGNDYNQYFQQTTTNASATGNADYGASSISNYYQNVEGTTTNIDYNNFSTQNTGHFDLNNLNLGQASITDNNVDLSQYNLGGDVSQVRNQISASYAIPATTISNISYNGNQQLASSYNEYKTTHITTTNAQSSYIAPSKSYSYNYTFATATPATSQAKF